MASKFKEVVGAEILFRLKKDGSFKGMQIKTTKTFPMLEPEDYLACAAVFDMYANSYRVCADYNAHHFSKQPSPVPVKCLGCCRVYGKEFFGYIRQGNGTYLCTHCDGRDTNLEAKLLDILGKHNGERGKTEGAVQVLERIIKERDRAMKKGKKR